MKRVTLEQLAPVLAALPDNPRVVVSGNFATPPALMAAFDSHVERYVLHALNAQKGLPDREGVTLETAFVGPGMRKSPRLSYVPCRLSLVPVLFQKALRPDVVLVHASAPRDDRTVSMGLECNILPAAIEAVKERGGIVVVQANPQMPYTFGDSQLNFEEIDYLVEVDEPVFTHTPDLPGEIAQQIGERIAHRIADGSTLQLGIGGVPDSVLAALGQRRGLRIWSEMFSDGVLPLSWKGCFDADIPLSASFIFGSRDLYDWVHLNRRVRLVRTERANDPGYIARQPMMTSVNSALQVDLFAQANASRVRNRIYSGFGGATDFIVGALHSRGGQAFLALPSWHPKADVSTVVPLIDEPVSSFQHTAVVTEQGMATVFGRNDQEQAREIITNAAHPSVREELWEEAAALGKV